MFIWAEESSPGLVTIEQMLIGATPAGATMPQRTTVQTAKREAIFRRRIRNVFTERE
jgi:hypothetical protein